MRVLHCPRNISGQAWEYAQGLRALGVDATVLTFEVHPYGFPQDICLDLPSEPNLFRKEWKRIKNFINVMNQYDVIHFHFSKTLLPFYLDLPLLRLRGKRMIMNYWGGDVRLAGIAGAKNRYYRLIAQVERDKPDIKKIRNIKRVAKHIAVAAVADCELYDYVKPFFKRVILIPQAIDTRRLIPIFPNPRRREPLVVHAPSRPGLKGTSYVEQAIRKLQCKYRFEFMLLHNVHNRMVRDVFRRADVIIDQLLLGTYGITAIEAMAFGKPVLCYIREDLVSKYPDDLPIVNANPDSIEEQLERLLLDARLRTEIGKRSRAFVERYHDSQVVAQKLLRVYERL